jgi:teichuronic acid exporter
VQHDNAALRRYWLGITEGISLVTFPLTVGLALVAHDFVTLVLGAKWHSMIHALQILSLYAGFRSLLPLTSQLLVATRGASMDARYSVQVALVMPAAFWVGSHWGVTGIAAAWALVHPLFGLRLTRYGLRRIEARARDYLRALVPALTGIAAMALAVVAAGAAMPESWPGIPRLAIRVAIGAAVYPAALFVFHRDRLLAFRQLWSQMRAR